MSLLTSAVTFLLLLSGVLVNCFGSDEAFQKLLTEAEAQNQKGQTQEALESYLAAAELHTNSAIVSCGLARQYCDLMFDVSSEKEKSGLARNALQHALRAVELDPESANAHLTLGVCYGKLYPFSNNQTKVDYSRLIKQEAEKAIQLDPKNDLSYHLLGRWHSEVANMNFFLKGFAKLAYGGLPAASDDLAIKNFRKAIELSPDRIIHRYQLSKILLRKGEKGEALKQMRLCLTLKPMDKDDLEAQKNAARRLTLIRQLEELDFSASF